MKILYLGYSNTLKFDGTSLKKINTDIFDK